MHIISQRRIRDYSAQRPDCRSALASWYRIAKAATWNNLAEVRRDFPHADAVGNKTVFNIRGNTYRLITAIHYNKHRVHIRELLTHAEYDRGDWKAR